MVILSYCVVWCHHHFTVTAAIFNARYCQQTIGVIMEPLRHHHHYSVIIMLSILTLTPVTTLLLHSQPTRLRSTKDVRYASKPCHYLLNFS